MKNRLLRLCIIVGLAFSACSAMALDWTCSISIAGPEQDGTVWIRVTETGGAPAFTNRWFKMAGSTTAVNRMLAVALSAMSSGMDVIITADSATAGSAVTYVGLVR